MLINRSYSTLTNIVNIVQNPSLPVGTLIEEIPCDIGRAGEGYKRGGIIEGAEKLRREVFAAIIWLFGMPVFRFLGDKVFENLFKIPMNIDFSNAKEGNDAIGNSIRYLRDGIKNSATPDVSELSKYGKKITDNLKNMNTEDIIKKVSFAKKFTSISALILNCLAMGVILPKYNQMLTRRKLEKMNRNKTLLNNIKFDDYKEKTQKSSYSNSPSFTGFFASKMGDIRNYGLGGFVTYNVENSNVFRLAATDVPMTVGRVLTSRNKFEGFENFFMDAASVYFYNFCANHIQKFMRKKFDIPNINPANVEAIKGSDDEVIIRAFNSISEIPSSSGEKLRYLFKDNSFVDEMYRQATYGKYGKINRFVKNSDIASIDEATIKFLSKAKEISYIDGIFNKDKFLEYAKKVNSANSKYLALGLGVAIFGLSILVPKLTFWITRKLTGRNEFTGIADYSDLDKKNKKSVNKS